ncbi:PH domain-containing protein [Bacillus badius]|uniref:YdbS-like PH domain-containing protein n=1 Tax=Bacillus badius TaxID=1455 RepID=A0ABR5AR19_BACBA|nr:PH domain-containing protein [Bacillus badius]KIL77211.1 hypothetical protein SD77_1658 [Bacillus badius]MED4717575.1 PH domain-containing protein [Bacillus badius]
MKRQHPLYMLYKLGGVLRNAFFFWLFLCVIKADSTSAFIHYGRIVFYIALPFSIAQLIYKWLTAVYRLDEHAFQLRSGIWHHAITTIPYRKVQQTVRHRSWFHRLFGVTAIRFETGTGEEEAAAAFDVLSEAEARRMEAYAEGNSGEWQAEKGTKPDITVHFEADKRELLKASFTSLRFLVFIPFFVSIYFKIDDVLPLEKRHLSIELFVQQQPAYLIACAAVLLVCGTLGGMIYTFVQYSSDQITSDQERIYVRKGAWKETQLSIQKRNVQTIEVKQSLVKRLLGLAQINLIAVSGENGEDERKVHELYPFFPVERAWDLVSELLPHYELHGRMHPLPKKALWIKLLMSSWFCGGAAIALYALKEHLPAPWWLLAIAVFGSTSCFAFLGHRHTRFALSGDQIQWQRGVLTTTLCIVKRSKIVEMKKKQGLVQRIMGMATVEFAHRLNPVRVRSISGLPAEFAETCRRWYVQGPKGFDS